jgi:hypothetical protein
MNLSSFPLDVILTLDFVDFGFFPNNNTLNSDFLNITRVIQAYNYLVDCGRSCYGILKWKKGYFTGTCGTQSLHSSFLVSWHIKTQAISNTNMLTQNQEIKFADPQNFDPSFKLRTINNEACFVQEPIGKICSGKASYIYCMAGVVIFRVK